MKKKKLIVWLFIGLQGMLFAQHELLDSATLFTCREFTDLASALEYPENVVRLSLRKQKLKSFPKEIYQFKNLQYLDLSKNFLKELPDSIIGFKRLQYLIVSKNKLKVLPRDLGKLKSLIVLNVNQNDLSTLPYSIGELENLEVADLWSNNLDTFPESMTKLKKLKWMDLRNILIPQEHQDRIQNMVPQARVEFSPPCKCSW